MKNFALMLKPFALSIALLAIFAAGQTIAKADPVTVSGTSTGTVTGTAANFLSFQGNTFTATTAGGVGSFSGTNRIGTFFLAPTTGETPVTGNFTLNLTFTAPSGINGGQGATYTATVSGVVSTTGAGGVEVVFDNPNQTFTFSNPNGSGTFTIELANNIFVQSGNSANLTAGLRGEQTPVPEPATMILLGTGLAGVAARIRKRRKDAQS
ncbi:MAG TPA: PEP-CTERM sorting domain-containing protein [Pyrinomonadaceae bacterium]|nr:PEP-CTERM sorting domain-containing protein [Pyrinomonadaceae bacterium]